MLDFERLESIWVKLNAELLLQLGGYSHKKTGIKSNSLHAEIPNSLRLEIPRYLEIALGHFCETSLAKSISRESANKDCNSIKSENHCDVIVT